MKVILQKKKRCAALLTVKPGKENRALQDIKDLVFPYDPSIQLIKTKYSGLLLLFTDLEKEEILRLLSSVPLPFLIKTTVFDKYALDPKEYNDIVLYVKERLSKFKSDEYVVLIKLNIRGNNNKILALTRTINSILNISHKKENIRKTIVVKIDIIDNFVGLNIDMT